MLIGRRTLLVACLLLLTGTQPGIAGAGRPAAPPLAADSLAGDSLRGTEIGLPLLTENYSAEAYEQHAQNWGITQDERGVVYVANNDGILEYDGSRWRFIPTAANTFVRSLAYGAVAPESSHGSQRASERSSELRVWVGVQGDFGYLAPDSIGRMRYVSLRRHVDPADLDFNDVWTTHVVGGAVYFQTNSRLFRWDGHDMTSWESEEGFHIAFAVRGRLYVREIGRGLLRMEENALQLIPGGERFAETPVHMVAPYADGRMLIGTFEGSFFLYQEPPSGQEAEDVLTPFETEAAPFVERSRLYHGTALPGGFYALATLGNGALIIDQEGRIVQILDEAVRVPDGMVNYVYAGRQGTLWMALNSGGVARARVPSELSTYDERLGLSGTINAIKRHRGTIYVATASGIFRLQKRPFTLRARDQMQRTAFVPVSNAPPSVWSLRSTEHGLLAATDFGTYLINGNEAQQITDEKSYSIIASDEEESTYYVAGARGLFVLQYNPSGWRLQQVPGIDASIQSIKEGPDGSLWLGAGQERQVLRMTPPPGWLSPDFQPEEAPPHVQRFDPSDGLPSEYLRVGTIDGEIVASSSAGVYRYRGTSSGDPAFYRDTTIYDPERAGSDLLSFMQDGHGNLWAAHEDAITVLAPQLTGGYARLWPERLQLPTDYSLQIYVEHDPPSASGPGGVRPPGVEGDVLKPGTLVWLGNGRDLIRYEPGLLHASGRARALRADRPEAIVREVRTIGGDVLFGGAHPAEGLARAATHIPYARANLRFAYAAPTYNAPKPTTYQYRLIGADEPWSAWTSATAVSFPNLWEGAYRFQVRARSGEVVSDVATLAFRVLPPWYRTAWAYASYLALVALGLVGGWHYRKLMHENRRARAQAEELRHERQARARLEEANRRIEEANRQLEQANHLKDNFLATTSHELRTPLTAILGFTSVLKEETRHEQHREFLELIEQSGDRLMETLSALLDIARIRSGLDDVETEPTDVCAHVQAAVRLFTPLARRKGLALRATCPEAPARALLNAGYTDRILHNLIGNAIKFTDDGGVSVHVERLPLAQGNGAQSNGAHGPAEVAVHVRDTGAGISEDFLPRLFEEFRQESSGMARTHTGSGLGLSISARLVEAMNGRIEVETKKDVGSCFSVYFPLLDYDEAAAT